HTLNWRGEYSRAAKAILSGSTSTPCTGWVRAIAAVRSPYPQPKSRTSPSRPRSMSRTARWRRRWCQVGRAPLKKLEGVAGSARRRGDIVEFPTSEDVGGNKPKGDAIGAPADALPRRVGRRFPETPRHNTLLEIRFWGGQRRRPPRARRATPPREGREQ